MTVVSYPLGPAFYDKDGETWFRFTIDRANRIERPAREEDRLKYPGAFEAYQPQPVEPPVFTPHEGYETLNIAADSVSGAAPEKPDIESLSKEGLQEFLVLNGVTVDGRWGEEKLREMARAI